MESSLTGLVAKIFSKHFIKHIFSSCYPAYLTVPRPWLQEKPERTIFLVSEEWVAKYSESIIE